MACPSWEQPIGGDSIFYNALGSENYGRPQQIHTTYIYVGGEANFPTRVDPLTGLVIPNRHGDYGAGPSGGWWWHGWSCGAGGGTGASGYARYLRYDDHNQIGPAWHTTARNRTAATAIVTDRMWLPGQTRYPGLNWNHDDPCAPIQLNHPQGIDGEVDGGSVGMVDGHVEFRNRDVLEQNFIILGGNPVKAYGEYEPFVNY